MNFFKKANNGITLIALVITIIVLLILAGVSIATLTGENGILTRANTAKERTQEGEAEEIFKLIANEWQIEKRANKNADLADFLGEKATEYGTKLKVTGTEAPFTLEYNGEKVTIDNNGTLTEAVEEEPAALAAGLYDAEGNLTKTWAQLIADGDLIVTDGVLVGGGEDTYCKTGHVFNGIGKLVIDKSVTSIGDSAFGCGPCPARSENLTEVIIPNTVTSIGKYAFTDCQSLKSITIPNSVTSIGEDAFMSSTALTSIYIPSSVETISPSLGGTAGPFNSCSPNLKIYCESSNSLPGWG